MYMVRQIESGCVISVFDMIVGAKVCDQCKNGMAESARGVINVYMV